MPAPVCQIEKKTQERVLALPRQSCARLLSQASHKLKIALL